jgi:perosamine synthetase
MPAEPSHFRMSKDPVLHRRFLKMSSRSVKVGGVQGGTQTYFFLQARNAIYHGLRALHLSPGEAVLMPSYLCAAAIEPVLALGLKAEFYRIDRDCTPDLGDLERRIRPDTRAVFAVHYFGFPCDIGKFRELCDRRGLFLVEDCAHVLHREIAAKPLGAFGDISVFSWRKFLPLYDGGELILNYPCQTSFPWAKETDLFTLKAARNLLEQSAEYGESMLVKGISSLLGMAKHSWDRMPRKGTRAASAPKVNPIYLEFDESQVNLPMSRISRWVFHHSDMASILVKRRENYMFLRRELSSVSGIHLVLPDSADAQSPWVFPVIFEGLKQAHLALRKRGIPAVTWGGVRHPSISRAEFPEADFLYENLVMLPVHQDLSERDLRTIAEEARAIRQASEVGTPGNFTTTLNSPGKSKTIA